MSTTARGTGARREEEMVAPNVHKHHTHDRKDEVRQLFAQYDSNKDGHLTLDEVARVFKERTRSHTFPEPHTTRHDTRATALTAHHTHTTRHDTRSGNERGGRADGLQDVQPR
jgi:hypothetical protein